MQHHDGLEFLLRHIVHVGGSDLLLTSGSAPLVRIDGALRPLADGALLDDRMLDELLDVLLDPHQLATLDAERDLDFAFSYAGERFRGNAFYQRGRPAVSLRLMQTRIPSFDEIGLPFPVRDLVRRQQGLVLFTGPTGSGKSTTLATLVDAINEARPCHILTIEDPIEYLHQNKVAAISQREVGIDAPSFQRALRSALREDPDVVLVGEMRDPESISITLTLAETGHLVLSSLHTNDAPQALDRIVDVFAAEQQPQVRLQLASVLRAVVAQRLLPRIGGGMVAAYEVLIGTPAVSNLIREGKTRQIRNAMQMGQADGCMTFEQSLNALVAHGFITHETALSHAFVPAEIHAPPVTAPTQ